MKRIAQCLAIVLLSAGSLYSIAVAQDRLLTHQKTGQRRIALVIGNADYLSEGNRLDNPVNDARLVRNALQSLGFEVIHGENLTNAEIKNRISSFSKKIERGGVALFYYAGHGVQYKGLNFIVPVDIREFAEDEIEDQALNVEVVLDAMASAQADVNIMILDACRSNPMTRSWTNKRDGLMPLTGPKGTLIAYATSPGRVADDGRGKANSPYTQALVRWMKEPCLRIEDMFKKVRRDVLADSKDRQLTWESGSLIGDFYFVNERCVAPIASESKPAPVTDQPLTNRILLPVRRVLVHGPELSFSGVDEKKSKELRQEFLTPLSLALSRSGLTVEDSAALDERDRIQLDGDLEPIVTIDGKPQFRQKYPLQWLPQALVINFYIFSEDIKESSKTFITEAWLTASVYSTVDGKMVATYSGVLNKVRGYGSTEEQARRNALRAVAQQIPAEFIKSIAEKAK